VITIDKCFCFVLICCLLFCYYIAKLRYGDQPYIELGQENKKQNFKMEIATGLLLISSKHLPYAKIDALQITY